MSSHPCAVAGPVLETDKSTDLSTSSSSCTAIVCKLKTMQLCKHKHMRSKLKRSLQLHMRPSRGWWCSALQTCPYGPSHDSNCIWLYQILLSACCLGNRDRQTQSLERLHGITVAQAWDVLLQLCHWCWPTLPLHHGSNFTACKGWLSS